LQRSVYVGPRPGGERSGRTPKSALWITQGLPSCLWTAENLCVFPMRVAIHGERDEGRTDQFWKLNCTENAKKQASPSGRERQSQGGGRGTCALGALDGSPRPALCYPRKTEAAQAQASGPFRACESTPQSDGLKPGGARAQRRHPQLRRSAPRKDHNWPPPRTPPGVPPATIRLRKEGTEGLSPRGPLRVRDRK
jgi:hypothetical protein